MMSKRLYFDNNSTTPLDPRLASFAAETLLRLHGNPSSFHSEGQQMRRMVNQAREAIAAYFHVRSQEIVFTSSGTESINMLIRGVAALSTPGHIVTSSVEHMCTLATIKALEKTGWTATYLAPGAWGAVTREAVSAAIRPDTKLIALMAANNETGVKTEIAAIGEMARSRQIPFIVDGVALLGKEPCVIPDSVSAVAFSGHKVHALQGSGFAFVRSRLPLLPQITGGGQEFGRRAGTENLLAILCLEKAIALLSAEMEQATTKMLQLRDRFEQELQSHLPAVLINGTGPRVCNVSNLAFMGIDGESMLIALDRAGMAASHGSACASGGLEPSHVLLNMGYDLERVRSSVRFSFSRLNTAEEVEEACRIIVGIVRSIVV